MPYDHIQTRRDFYFLSVAQGSRQMPIIVGRYLVAFVSFLACCPLVRSDDLLNMELEYQMLISDTWKWQEGLKTIPFRYSWEAPKYGMSRGVVCLENGKGVVHREFSGSRNGADPEYQTSSALVETWFEAKNCWRYNQVMCQVGKFSDEIRNWPSDWPALPFLWCSYGDEFLPLYCFLRPKIMLKDFSTEVTSNDGQIRIARKLETESTFSSIVLIFLKDSRLPLYYESDYESPDERIRKSGTFKWERFGDKTLLQEAVHKKDSKIISELRCEPLSEEEIAKYQRKTFQDFWDKLPKGTRILDSTEGDIPVVKGYIGTEEDYKQTLVIEQAESQRELKANRK